MIIRKFNRLLHSTSFLSEFRNINDYHKVSDRVMDSLVDQLWDVEDQVNVKDYDVEYSAGVLTLKVGKLGTFVINKQPPNQQIWLSSPLSGPKRYDYDEASKRWVYHRDKSTIDSLLSSELSDMLKSKIKISLEDDE